MKRPTQPSTISTVLFHSHDPPAAASTPNGNRHRKENFYQGEMRPPSQTSFLPLRLPRPPTNPPLLPSIPPPLLPIPRPPHLPPPPLKHDIIARKEREPEQIRHRRILHARIAVAGCAHATRQLFCRNVIGHQTKGARLTQRTSRRHIEGETDHGSAGDGSGAVAGADVEGQVGEAGGAGDEPGGWLVGGFL